MFENPFSPIFGGKPDIFFGRSEILERFDLAMMNPGSDGKAMFITGTRGSGKTSLLEQLSIRAKNKNRVVIDLGPDNMISQLISELSDFDETTTTISPQASVSIFGIGGSFSGGSVSKTKRTGKEKLQSILIDVCKKSENGILVTIDEIQKVNIDDISALCNAFQMASRKGFDIMLAVAGLPYSHAKIIEHEGCTYLRRAAFEEIGLFTWEETDDAFHNAFSKIKGLNISNEFVDKINETSFGHPYLMQLLGYYLLIQVNNTNPKINYTVTQSELSPAISNALIAYKSSALKPLLSELSESEQKYLKTMSASLDDDRLAPTSKIADTLHVSQKNLSRVRANLIDNGIIAAPEHGKVMFCIPYLADYVKTENTVNGVIEIARKRRV